MVRASGVAGRRGLRWVAAALAAVGAASLAAAAPSHYHLIKSVALGGTSGWDYITLDPETRRLFITRDSHVTVVDAGTGRLIGEVGGLEHIHGVALAGGHAYISDGGADSVVVIDRRTLRKLRSIHVGHGPDAIVYDSFSGRVFAFDGRSGDATAIDARTGQVAGTVPLGGKPEAPATDGAGTIFVNIEDKSEVAAFDSRTLKVERRWTLAPCGDPTGIAIDAAHARLFSGCRSGVIAVSDTKAGRVVTTIPIGRGVDSNRFDPADGLVFSSNGISGTLTVAREVTPNDYEVLESVPTAQSARTMDLDPKTHRIYLVAAKLRFAAGRTPSRPSIEPGSFRLLILGR